MIESITFRLGKECQCQGGGKGVVQAPLLRESNAIDRGNNRVVGEREIIPQSAQRNTCYPLWRVRDARFRRAGREDNKREKERNGMQMAAAGAYMHTATQ